MENKTLLTALLGGPPRFLEEQANKLMTDICNDGKKAVMVAFDRLRKNLYPVALSDYKNAIPGLVIEWEGQEKELSRFWESYPTSRAGVATKLLFCMALKNSDKYLGDKAFENVMKPWRWVYAIAYSDFSRLADAVLNQAKEKLSPPKKKRRIMKEEANVAAREILKNPALRSLRKLAKAIGCSTGLVPELPMWRAYQEKLEKLGKKKHFGAKARRLDGVVLDNKPCNDAELERLIAEQTADFEDSPLVSHARKHHVRKKV